jgi:hypothetical protein
MIRQQQMVRQQSHHWQAQNQHQPPLYQQASAGSPRTLQQGQQHQTSPPSVFPTSSVSQTSPTGVSETVAAAAADAQKIKALEHVARVEQEVRINLQKELHEVKEAHRKEVQHLTKHFEEVKHALMMQHLDAMRKQSEIQEDIARWVEEFQNLSGVVKANSELQAQMDRLSETCQAQAQELLSKDEMIYDLKNALRGEVDGQSISQDENEGILTVSKKRALLTAKPGVIRAEDSTPGGSEESRTGGGSEKDLLASGGNTPRDVGDWRVLQTGPALQMQVAATSMSSPRTPRAAANLKSPQVLHPAPRPRTPPPLTDNQSKIPDDTQILMLAGDQLKLGKSEKQSDAGVERPRGGGGRSMSGHSSGSTGSASSSSSMAILEAQSQLLATLRDQLQGVSGLNQVHQETLETLIKVTDPRMKIPSQSTRAVLSRAQPTLQKEVEMLQKEQEQVREVARKSREAEIVFIRRLDASNDDLNRELADQQTTGRVRALKREPILGRSEQTHALIKAVTALSNEMSGIGDPRSETASAWGGVQARTPSGGQVASSPLVSTPKGGDGEGTPRDSREAVSTQPKRTPRWLCVCVRCGVVCMCLMSLLVGAPSGFTSSCDCVELAACFCPRLRK